MAMEGKTRKERTTKGRPTILIYQPSQRINGHLRSARQVPRRGCTQPMHSRSSTFYLANSQRGAARDWARMNNQALGSAWNNLAIEELADGLELLRTAARSGGINELKLFTLVNVILARGFTEGKARTVVVRSDWPKTDEEIVDPTLVLPAEDRPGEWLIPVIPIPYSENHKEEYPGCHKCEKWFPLADYWGVGAPMRRLLGLRGWDWTGNPVLPFALRAG